MRSVPRLGPPHTATLRRLETSSGRLVGVVLARLEERPWYRGMTPDRRSWVGMVLQTGIGGFAEWEPPW
jgi:hypothetical protein